MFRIGNNNKFGENRNNKINVIYKNKRMIANKIQTKTISFFAHSNPRQYINLHLKSFSYF